MSDSGFDKTPIRKEADLRFGNELKEAVEHINQGIIITGPSHSGKTVLATAITTLGLASRDMITEKATNLLPDLALGGYSTESAQFQKDTQEDINRILEEYLDRYQNLPPILMVDEVTPPYIAFLNQFVDRINQFYSHNNMQHPRFVWVLQGNEPIQMLEGDFEAFHSAYQIDLHKKTADSTSNNVGYRVAAAQTNILKNSLGEGIFNDFVNLLQQQI